jgi:hypothetical protein
MKMIQDIPLAFIEWPGFEETDFSGREHGDIVELCGSAGFLVNTEPDDAKPKRIAPALWLGIALPTAPLEPATISWSIPSWFQRDLIDGHSGSWELDLMLRDTVKFLAYRIPEVEIQPEPHELLGVIEGWRLEKLSKD